MVCACTGNTTKPVTCPSKLSPNLIIHFSILQLPAVASTSQVKPDSPLEEDSHVNEAEAAMEERREAKKPEESRLSAGGAHNTKEETQSAQQTSRQASP